MRLLPLLPLLALPALGLVLSACGGATSGTNDGTGTSTGDTTRPGATADPPSSQPPSVVEQTPGVVGASCPSPTTVVATSGSAIVRPAGSALRLQLVYQGASIGVTNVRGVDMVLPPASGPFTPGAVAGYWVETRSASATTYQHIFQDPTVQEGFGGPGPGGGFSNTTIPQCTPKTIQADVPNDGSTSEIRVYGSPYGTNDGAVELARFTVQ